MQKFKMAFVGPSEIHEAFKELDDSWDLQVPLNSLDELETEFSLDDNEARISKETSVIILFSRLFPNSPEQFANIVAYSAPYSVVCILIPQQDRAKYGDDLERAIKKEQMKEAQVNDTYNSNTPFYLVDYENVQADIYEAINNFVNSPIIDPTIKAAIKPMLPNQEDELDDLFEDFNDYNDDEFVLPDAPEGAKGQVFTVTSSKGGSGKSTVAITLGAYIALASKEASRQGLSSKPLKVCLVDLDTRDGQHWILMGARRPATVIDILGNGGPTEENIKDAVWSSDKTLCDYLFAPKRPRSAKEIPHSFYAELIQQLRSMYDIIILDTSVNYLDTLQESVAYPLSDKIIFVSDMGRSSILGCTRWIQEEMHSEELGENAIPRDKVGVVINKALPSVNMSAQKIEKAINGLPILAMIPSDPELIVYAGNVSELQQILKVPLINTAFKNIAEAVLPDEPLADVYK